MNRLALLLPLLALAAGCALRSRGDIDLSFAELFSRPVASTPLERLALRAERQTRLDGLLATTSPAASAPHAESALHRGHDPRPRLAAEDNEVAGQRVEDLVQLPEALAQIGRRRRVLGFPLCATQSPAAEETHAESAESAEPKPHAESAESESHAENAEGAEL